MAKKTKKKKDIEIRGNSGEDMKKLYKKWKDKFEEKKITKILIETLDVQTTDTILRAEWQEEKNFFEKEKKKLTDILIEGLED